MGRNPLITREDVQAAVHELSRPLLSYYSPGKARVRLGATASGCSPAAAELEGFSRVLWGLAPLAAGGGDSELWETVREGVRNGTDPDHPEYWGDADDYDQRLVEMAAIGLALALAPDRIWTPLEAQERRRLHAWLAQINERKLHDCNWLLFQVIVNLGFRAVGLPYDAEGMRRNLDRVDSFHISDGWYADGPDGPCDYYGPFAIHYAGLIYATLMEKEDPARAAAYKERAAAFAKEFVYWFAGDGSALPYGRSLTYRFTQAAFWSALAFAGVEPFPMGAIKGLMLRNLRWWLAQPIFQADGTLTIGYAYPNLVMAENYNAPGSPYWAFKAFLPLALPPEHPFWQAEELPLPALDEGCAHRSSRQIVRREAARDHSVLFNAGHRRPNGHTHGAAKYEKFAYSNRFGFSVPRAEWGLSQGAYDSMLALSEGDELFRVKRNAEETAVLEDGNVLYARWRPWGDVEVRTWLVAGAPWHVRVHRIHTRRSLVAADGGFAIGVGERRVPEGEHWTASQGEDELVVVTSHGASGVIRLGGEGAAELVHPNANTNVLHARTLLPTVVHRVEPGVAWLATGVYGQPGAGGVLADWALPPTVDFEADEIVVAWGDGRAGIRIRSDGW